MAGLAFVQQEKAISVPQPAEKGVQRRKCQSVRALQKRGVCNGTRRASLAAAKLAITVNNAVEWLSNWRRAAVTSDQPSASATPYDGAGRGRSRPPPSRRRSPVG